MLVWLDLETTGLHPRLDRILAVGVIVTDRKLHETARHEWVLSCDTETLDKLCDDKVKRMHSRNGLLTRVATEGVSNLVVYRELNSFLDANAGELPTLAGSSVHFDYRFIDDQWDMGARFHHRLLDVSCLRVLAELLAVPGFDKVVEGWPAHTPLKDLERSIQLLRGYEGLLFKPECRL